MPKRRIDEERADPSFRLRAASKAQRQSSELLYGIAKDKEQQKQHQKEEQRKQKQAKENLLASFKCPLSHALFLDPVSMVDGHTYDRDGAEEHIRIERSAERPIKSPTTGAVLGNATLTPNVALRSALESAIEMGSIDGELVDEYKAAMKVRNANAKALAELRQAADKGDLQKNFELANAYECGRHGLKKDLATAYTRFKMGADAGHVTSTAFVGWKLGRGLGVALNVVEGAVYLGVAAEKGSEAACAIIAEAYQTGMVGFNFNLTEARKWYSKMAACKFKDAKPVHREKRDQLLA